MLTKKQIMESFNLSEITKEYPKSGQKQVVLCKHENYGEVILKLVDNGSERVKREVDIVTKNKFNNVPQIIKIDDYNIEDNKGIYIFEEYIKGSTLREILKNEKLKIEDAMFLAESILNIIIEMEKNGVVHRDIKPENIIKSVNNQWYLIDFGIARALNLNSLTMTEMKIGPHTPGYGAPELFQYSKKDIDSRADIFSLGVVLFESATGQHPFIKGDEIDVNEVWYDTVTIEPEIVVIDGDIDMQFMGLIQTFMQKHISRRPKTAIKALEWYINVKENIKERKK